MAARSKSGNVDATGDVNLGEAMGGKVSSWLVHLDADGAFSGSVQPVGRAAASDAGGAATIDLAYKDMNTGTNATAALTTDALILIDGAGIEVILEFTVSAGSIDYFAVPLLG